MLFLWGGGEKRSCLKAIFPTANTGVIGSSTSGPSKTVSLMRGSILIEKRLSQLAVSFPGSEKARGSKGKGGRLLWRQETRGGGATSGGQKAYARKSRDTLTEGKEKTETV